MRRTDKEILEAYRKGDLAERLDLFLTYRGLREGFIEIEQSLPGSVVSEKRVCRDTNPIRASGEGLTGFCMPFFAGIRSRVRGWILG